MTALSVAWTGPSRRVHCIRPSRDALGAATAKCPIELAQKWCNTGYAGCCLR